MRRSPIFLIAAAFITLLLVPMASAGAGGTDRPFQATLIGAGHWQFPGVSPSHCTVVTTLTEATGQATHLGQVEAFLSHCPGEPAYVNNGRLTIIAANGDELHGTYDYDPTKHPAITAITLDGGTGRFADASGAVGINYTVTQQFIPGCNPVPDPFPCFDFSVPWPWSATLTGTISY